MNWIAEKTEKDDRKFELVEEEGEMLRDLNTYIPKLMNYLWEKPKIVAQIIQKTDTKDVEEYLAPLFSNNFYENILSSSYIEYNLMYLLTILLDGEIKNLDNVNQFDKFLEESQCGYLLGELRKKNDIQSFFKNIIQDGIENLENNYSSLNIILNIDIIDNEFKEKLSNHGINIKKLDEEGFLKSENNIQYNDEDTNEKRNKKQFKSEQENFNQKYVPSLDKKTLHQLMKEKEKNKRMKDFLYTKINDCDSNDYFYSNNLLMKQLYKCKYSPQYLLRYQKSFMVIINFINSIIDKIINNSHKLPYSSRCLCKIISLLIKKRFPSISEIEKNAFIAKFFFGKLLTPILKNPVIEALIGNFIINSNTLNNLKIIGDIINKFTSGVFYKETESEYTPFNWYFIEKMEKLFEIFDHITKVTLPEFIEDFINDKLPPNYEYEYFKENQDQAMMHQSMFYNLSQIDIIVKTMNKFKKEIFISDKTKGLEKTLEKLVYSKNQELLDNILKSEIKADNKVQIQKSKKSKNEPEEQSEPKLHYFLIESIKYNDKYKKLFSIEQKTSCFTIKEIKNISDEKSITKNNIIRVKNLFCSLLYNYNYLLKTDFNEGKFNNTEEILVELLKSSSSVFDGSIPSEWYVTSLLEYLKKIPEDLTKNDCEKLYNEIENDVNKSIKELDLEALSAIMEKLKFAKRGKIFFEDSKQLLKDIDLNEEIKNIMEKEYIPILIKFSYEDDIKKEFSICPSKFKEKNKENQSKIKDYQKKQNNELCFTINEFTKKFPNLLKYEELQDLNIFEIQESLSFPKVINDYLNIVKKSIEKKYNKDLELIMEKIYYYIMIKLYDKLFPIEPNEKDNKIFQQSIKLSWTEPKHFLGNKKYVFGSFLTDTSKYYNLIDNEKSPIKKALYLSEIFNSIELLMKFNGIGDDIGVDDQMPILNYATIKAAPFRMYSNAKFMELYSGDLKHQNQDSQLVQFLGICDILTEMEYSKLYGVTKEEYIKKVNEEIAKDIKNNEKN